MRVATGLVFLLPLLLCGCGVQAQRPGFFSGFNNFVSNGLSMVNRFNPFRGNRFQSRPAPSRPAPSFSSQPAPSFSSQPSFSSAPAPAPPASFSRPVITSITRPNSAPLPAVSSNSGQTSQQLNIAPAPAPTSSSSGGRGNHQWNGGDYLLSWREGQNALSWNQARSYCSSRGMRMISMDSPAKVAHFLQQVVADRSPYFWAGGRLSSDKRTLTWENGRSEGVRKGQHPWSFTGSRGAQPDGGPGSEQCLAVLNNFYNDGSKFHDVGCSHTKPTVCEA